MRIARQKDRLGSPVRMLWWVVVMVASPLAPAAVLAQASAVEAGKIAYLRECAGCHGASARGDGPDAAFLTSKPTDLLGSNVLGVYREEELQARIGEGKALALELRPEALAQHAVDTAALYGYLTKLPATDWEKVAGGQDLYFERCLDCHDRYGHPVAQPAKGVRTTPRDLADPAFQQAVSDEELHVLVRHGRKAMPALVPRLREEEVSPLVSFVRHLSPGYQTYEQFCSRCHGTRGTGQDFMAETGAPKVAFDASYFATHDAEQVQGAIWHMLRDNKPEMPHFSDSIDEMELGAILVYLRSLPRPTTSGSTPPHGS